MGTGCLKYDSRKIVQVKKLISELLKNNEENMIPTFYGGKMKKIIYLVVAFMFITGCTSLKTPEIFRNETSSPKIYLYPRFDNGIQLPPD